MSPKDTAVGTCFTDALAIAELPQIEEMWPVVVHGLPWGTGGDAGDRRFWHAWVECMGLAFVMINDKLTGIPIPLFYEAGRIEHTWRYTMDAAREHILRTGHSGPWEGDNEEDWEQIIRDLHPGERTEYDPIEESA